MENSNTLFIHLAIVLGLCAGTGYIVKTLRLPLLIAYLLIGVFLSSLRVFDIDSSQVLNVLPGIGVALVMFFVGLELNLRELKFLGKPIIITGLGQIFISSLSGFYIALLLGFSSSEAMLLGAGLAFSSTIVVVKMLLEKRDLKSLHGKLSLGITLLEDLVAIVILMALTVGSSVLNLGLQSGMPILTLVVKGVFLLGLSLFLSRYILTRVFKAVADSTELLFLSAISWCFIFVTLSLLLGFSVVIGAFLAGVALASSPFHYAIQSKVKPLRDFFVTLFFVYIGSHVIFQDLAIVLPLVILFTLFVFIVKPIIFLLFLGAFGFRRHTIFQTSLILSEVSEFSLVVMIVGFQLGLVSQAGLTAMALVGVISIISSSVAISYSKPVYRVMTPFIDLFVHNKFVHKIEEYNNDVSVSDHVIVVGAHRIGGAIVKYLKREGIPFLVLDFNPEVIQTLISEKINAFYGDIGDSEILEFLNLGECKLIISTAQNLDDNLMLLSEVKRRKVNAVVIARSVAASDARKLYEAGASYVILPEIVSGDYITQILKNHWPNMSFFKNRPEIELSKLARNHLALE